MYGLINQAIRGLVIENFGEEMWARIRTSAGVETDDFVSMQSYDDAVTYELVGAASKELDLPAETVLETFGKYWVNYVGQENYGELMNAAGDDLPTFLENLDQMHARIMLSFPELNPPTFRVTDRSENSLVLHYHSERPGLAPLVVGLLHGLGHRFKTDVSVEHDRQDFGDGEHDVFTVRYKPASVSGESL